ncbi:hypothetical protein MVEN_00596500 [Mycena venus]|uniref:Uncharacterized protein n=1 Tax=Mycena venus TaxID=2733690 RepID=A0A8H7D885_9AGAR|nr:hypothetical protein MVEN_00596500 [Mycena venus]
MSSTISDRELANLPALRRRFHALEEDQIKTLAASLFRPEILRQFKSQGTDEVAVMRLMLEMKVMADVQSTAQASESERARRAPKSTETGHQGVATRLSVRDVRKYRHRCSAPTLLCRAHDQAHRQTNPVL